MSLLFAKCILRQKWPQIKSLELHEGMCSMKIISEPKVIITAFHVRVLDEVYLMKRNNVVCDPCQSMYCE